MGGNAPLSVMLCVAGLFLSSTANADTTHYRGAHPIPAEQPGKFCYIGSTHTHTYMPANDSAPHFVAHPESGEHQESGGEAQLEFVGDPSEWGYDGPLIGYADAHPNHFEGGSAQIEQACHIEGSHFHLRAPIDASAFEDHTGTYYFGSYRAAIDARRAQQKLRKAEERRERRRARAERKSRSRKKSSTRSSLSSSKTPAPTTKTTRTPKPSSKPSSKPSKKPSSKPSSKPSKKGHRSWMQRRRGK